MEIKWFAGSFCPSGAECSLEEGALSPANGPKIRTLSDPHAYVGAIAVPTSGEGFSTAGLTPHDWIKCEGQVLEISQNTELFSVIGTTYGGDGRVSFGVPDFGDTGQDYYICAVGMMAYPD